MNDEFAEYFFRKKGNKEPKKVVWERASGTINGVHFDQVTTESGHITYYIQYQNGKRIYKKEEKEDYEVNKILLRKTKNLEIYVVPFFGIYPFNLCDKNLGPIPYGKVTDLWKEVWQFVWDHWDYYDKPFYDIVTAWILATWIPEKFNSVAYLAAIGDTGTGKTRLLECLAALCRLGLLSALLNEAPLFRSVTKWQPTLMIDESEVYNDSQRASVISLLNAGQRRNVIVQRTVKPYYELELFTLFGFKALAGTRKWLRTLERRSLIAYTTRNRRTVRRQIDAKRAREIRRKLLQYRIDYVDVSFEESYAKIKELTKTISGTIWELFSALFSVAPKSKWKSLLKYAVKEEEIREKETATSEMAEVFYAILELKAPTILISDVANYLNAQRARIDQLSNKEIGKTVSVLGFKKKHTRYGSVVIWRDETINRLKEQYGVESEKEAQNKRIGDDVTEKRPSAQSEFL